MSILTKIRKSPLDKKSLERKPIILRDKKLADLSVMSQQITLSDKTSPAMNFWKFIPENSNEASRILIFKIANSVSLKLADKASHDTVYNAYSTFSKYYDYCVSKKVDPISKEGYLSYLGKNGELVRLVELAKVPLAYLYLYENETEVGLSANSASSRAGFIKQYLNAAEIYEPTWDRDLPKHKSDPNPTKAYSQLEYLKALRRLQFVFFSISTQLIQLNEDNPNSTEAIYAVIDELDTGEILSIETDVNPKANVGSVNFKSAFNLAMTSAFYLFCHYSNFNTSSITGVCHPIKFENHHDNKQNRTTRYANIKAWKSRSTKVVESTFSEESEEGEITLEIDKRDGLSFIKTLIKLSTLVNGINSEEEHPPLFFNLSSDGNVHHFNLRQGSVNLLKVLNLYSDQKKLHTKYLIERFNELHDLKLLTTVKVVDGIVNKTQISVGTREYKLTLMRCAYAALRSITDIKLKDIYMPLTYSNVDQNGYVVVSFQYKQGNKGSFKVLSGYVPFLQKLENYSVGLNSLVASKHHPKQKITPYLLPLGRRYSTYQWNEEELAIRPFLSKIGIFLGDYLLDLNAMRFRATASNNNVNPDDGGLEVATSLLQNTIETLQGHYTAGNPDQNRLIVNQSLEVLEEIAHGYSLKDAKENVRKARSIEVLEYDAWKKLRQPTNLNGILCDGKPTGKAEKEHKASSKLAKKLINDDIEISCYQYDMCVECKSAKLVNDVDSAYKLLSFVELLEESEINQSDNDNLAIKAEQLLYLAEINLSEEILEAAEDKLAEEGRYPLHNNNYLNSMIKVNYDA